MDNKELIKEEKNIVKKILYAIKRFFKSKRNKNNTTSSNNIKVDIIEIQKRYEAGTLLEAEMSEIEKEELKNLYTIQIEALKNNIHRYKKEIENTKRSILVMKNNIDNKIQ